MFVDKIEALLAQRKVTKKEFLTAVGLGGNSFANWTRNHENPDDCLPTTKNLLKIANYFNVSLDYLLDRSDEPMIHRKKKNYSTYEQFLGMCDRKGETPEQVFETLKLPLFILREWSYGKTPSRHYEETGSRDVLWMLATHFEENHTSWDRPNPFTDDAKVQYELLSWFSGLSLYGKMKFVSNLPKYEDVEGVAVADISAPQKNEEVSSKTIQKSE